MWASVVVISSGLSCAPRMVTVKAMVVAAMMEVGIVLQSLERGRIRRKGGRWQVSRWMVETYWPTAVSCPSNRIVTGPKV